MRLGISSPLKHDNPEEWAYNQVKLGCSAVVFPVGSNEPETKIIAYSEIDPEMPMILEHLNTDEEYIRYLGYIKKEIV